MNTQTLEERIRTKARKEYIKELEDLFTPIHRAMRGNALTLDIEHPNGQSYGRNDKRYLDATQAIMAIQDALVKKYAMEREDDAINAFMHKVDELEAEVEELRDLAREG